MTEKEVKVSKQHVWVGVEDRHVHLRTDQLHSRSAWLRCISVELPDVGDTIEEGEIFAEIESAVDRA